MFITQTFQFVLCCRLIPSQVSVWWLQSNCVWLHKAGTLGRTRLMLLFINRTALKGVFHRSAAEQSSIFVLISSFGHQQVKFSVHSRVKFFFILFPLFSNKKVIYHDPNYMFSSHSNCLTFLVPEVCYFRSTCSCYGWLMSMLENWYG